MMNPPRSTIVRIQFSAFIVCLAGAMVMQGQTAPPAPAKPATAPATKSSTTPAAKASTPASTAAASTYKLPAGEKRYPAIPKVSFAVKYQDIKIGTGPVAESNKMWHVKYKGWRAADGVVFDNWEDHKQPLRDKDGKVVMGDDKKPKMGDAEPMAFPQGMGRLIPGFDYGLDGMHVGGKRRIFIPWEAAYGTRSIPDRPDHPGIPAKSDLIFDVELVEVTEMPAPPPMPAGRPMPPRPGQPGGPPNPGAPGAPGGLTPKPATPPQPGTPATPPSASQPSAPPATSTPPPASAPATQPAQPAPPPASTPKPQ
jgi:peptidylprolyl isomerase